MNIKRLLKDKYILILIAIVIFHLASNGLWEYLDKTPPAFDPSNHNRIAIEMKDCLLSLGKTSFSECMRLTPFYPPFMHYVVAVPMAIFGNNIAIAQYVNTLFFILIPIAVYLWAGEIFKSKKTAIISAFLVTLFPELYVISRALWQEVPVVAFVFLSYYFLLRSKNFKISKYTYLAFLILAIGMLTKWTTAVYLFIPFLVAFIYSFKIQPISKILTKVAIGGLIIAIIIGPWLLPNLKEFLFFSKFWSNPEPMEPKNILTIENSVYYLKSISTFTLGLIPITLFLLLSIPVAKRLSRSNMFSAFGTIIFTYIYYIILGNKDSRYMLPLLPIFVGVIVYGLYNLSNILKRDLKVTNEKTISYAHKLGYITIGTLLLYQTLQYVKFSYDVPKANIRIVKQLPIIGYADIINLSTQYYPAVPYNNSTNWPVEQIVEDIHKLSEGRQVQVQSNVEYPKINSSNLLLEARVKKYPILINASWQMPKVTRFKTDKEVIDFLLSKDFVLIPENEPTIGYFFFKPIYNQISMAVFNPTVNRRGMNLIKTYKLPYKELDKMLTNSKNDDVKFIREKYCADHQCDELYLYQIVDLKEYEHRTSAAVFKIENGVPDECLEISNKCNFSVVIPANGWVRIHGAGLGLDRDWWSYKASEGQGLVWMFINNSDKEMAINIQGWKGGNGTKSFILDRGEVSGIEIGDTLRVSVTELRTPGNCHEAGCITIGYAVWDCSKGICEKQYQYDPVEGRESKLVPNHNQLYPKL